MDAAAFFILDTGTKIRYYIIILTRYLLLTSSDKAAKGSLIQHPLPTQSRRSLCWLLSVTEQSAMHRKMQSCVFAPAKGDKEYMRACSQKAYGCRVIHGVPAVSFAVYLAFVTCAIRNVQDRLGIMAGASRSGSTDSLIGSLVFEEIRWRPHCVVAFLF